VLCNTAKLDLINGESMEVGDPLETALLKFAYSEGIDIEPYRTKYPKIKVRNRFHLKQKSWQRFIKQKEQM
jgi:magnesium-transporting ATPase (P-type)